MKIPVLDFTLNDFDKHLNQDVNRNILFSAPFGAGKTTFLNKYFEDHSEAFVTINLKPINYSMSNNRDVFELIKFDIVFELLTNYREDIDLGYFKPKITETLIPFLQADFKVTDFLVSLMELDSQVGKPMAKMVSTLFKSYSDLKDFINKRTEDESKDLFIHLKNMAVKKGTAYENDSLTQLLFEIVSRLKESSGKKTVLIIDDLDRLDPEHIFRLFNIFSAHNQSFGEENEENKFGFAKTIFVCDLENIRKIYHHKYGAEVDFKGYINKFYSTEPFEFNIEEIIRENIDKIQSYLFENLDEKYFGYFVKYASYKDPLITVLNDMIQEYQLHLRDLFHIQPINLKFLKLDSGSKMKYKFQYAPNRLLFAILKSFLGSWGKVEAVLEFMAGNHQRAITTGTEVYYENEERKNADILGICFYNEICSRVRVKKFYEINEMNVTYKVTGDIERLSEIRGMDFLTVTNVTAISSIAIGGNESLMEGKKLEVYPQLHNSFLKMKRDKLL